MTEPGGASTVVLTDAVESVRAGERTLGLAERLPVPMLPIGEYRFLFERSSTVSDRNFEGSAWRGAFGHALKQAVCVTRLARCESCLLLRSCAYPYIFETPPPAESAKMKRYRAAPHPFTFVLPFDEPRRDTEQCGAVGVTLIGHANRYLGYVIHALGAAGMEGVGRGRVRHALAAVQQRAQTTGEWLRVYARGETLRQCPPEVPPTPAVPQRVHLSLLTPLRVKREGRLVGADRLRFADLFSALLRRISMLTYFHGDSPLETEFRALSDAALAINAECPDLRWRDWTRYSTRQRSRMLMGGVVGQFTLRGDSLEPFWPYLWLGQWTHAGHAASMGLGRYRLDTLASLPNAPTIED